SNLLANATRFAERGSVINVDIEPDAFGGIRLSVSNDGPVITAEHLPQLFDRFYRVDRAREHGDTNHGLGLAIVAAIARMHGGTPFVRSIGGTTTVGFSISVSGERH
ncbi:MAG TPA: ATP-binding protein, partial [Nitrospira sp.]|nr:ATP-binding protein [Nitrospira sp.]